MNTNIKKKLWEHASDARREKNQQNAEQAARTQSTQTKTELLNKISHLMDQLITIDTIEELCRSLTAKLQDKITMMRDLYVHFV